MTSKITIIKVNKYIVYDGLRLDDIIKKNYFVSACITYSY